MSFRERRRVVITGMGVIAPNGQDLTTFWDSILAGHSAAGPVTRFDASAYPSRIAAEIQDFDVGKHLESRRARRFSLAIQFAVAAASQALRDATQSSEDPNIGDPERVGVIEGTSVSGIDAWLTGLPSFEQRGYRAISPFTLINGYSGAGAGEIAIELGIRGHACTYSTGSASGNDVMGYALRMIQDDEADVMVAGGAEAPLLEPLWGAFCRTKVMSTHNENPLTAMRPFDIARDGFVLGEGAAFLVMEELSHALSRGARIYAEVLGHGRACEAFHSVAPHPDGIGIHRAMEMALRNGGIDRSEVSYINAHGTATAVNDLVELKAVHAHFHPAAGLLAVSSTKAVTGHLLAAAGALETVVSTLAIHHQVIPKTTNLAVPEPGWDIDLVPIASRPYPIDVALNLSSGFGGKNSCLALRRYRPRS